MRTGNYVNRDKFSNSSGSGGARIGGSFYSGDISAHHGCYVAGADFFPADERDIRSFHHRVSGFDHSHQTFGLNHSERFTHSSSPRNRAAPLVRVALAHSEQFFHIAPRKQALFTEKLGDEGNARVMLDDVHAVKRGNQIRAIGDHAVIGHQDRIMIRNEWFERPGKFCGAGQSERRKRNASKCDNISASKGLSRGTPAAANPVAMGGCAWQTAFASKRRR